MDLTLHGKISNIPASEVMVTVDRQAPYTIRVRGRVDERVFFGPKLELWTEISTVPGSGKFTISDTLTNRGSEPQEFMLIYHANYGSPLLEQGARLVAAAERVAPFNEHAAKAANKTAHFVELDAFKGSTTNQLIDLADCRPYVGTKLDGKVCPAGRKKKKKKAVEPIVNYNENKIGPGVVKRD